MPSSLKAHKVEEPEAAKGNRAGEGAGGRLNEVRGKGPRMAATASLRERSEEAVRVHLNRVQDVESADGKEIAG